MPFAGSRFAVRFTLRSRSFTFAFSFALVRFCGSSFADFCVLWFCLSLVRSFVHARFAFTVHGCARSSVRSFLPFDLPMPSPFCCPVLYFPRSLPLPAPPLPFPTPTFGFTRLRFGSRSFCARTHARTFCAPFCAPVGTRVHARARFGFLRFARCAHLCCPTTLHVPISYLHPRVAVLHHPRTGSFCLCPTHVPVPRSRTRICCCPPAPRSFGTHRFAHLYPTHHVPPLPAVGFVRLLRSRAGCPAVAFAFTPVHAFTFVARAFARARSFSTRRTFVLHVRSFARTRTTPTTFYVPRFGSVAPRTTTFVAARFAARAAHAHAHAFCGCLFLFCLHILQFTVFGYSLPFTVLILFTVILHVCILFVVLHLRFVTFYLYLCHICCCCILHTFIQFSSQFSYLFIYLYSSTLLSPVYTFVVQFLLQLQFYLLPFAFDTHHPHPLFCLRSFTVIYLLLLLQLRLHFTFYFVRLRFYLPPFYVLRVLFLPPFYTHFGYSLVHSVPVYVAFTFTRLRLRYLPFAFVVVYLRVLFPVCLLYIYICSTYILFYTFVFTLLHVYLLRLHVYLVTLFVLLICSLFTLHVHFAFVFVYLIWLFVVVVVPLYFS